MKKQSLKTKIGKIKKKTIVDLNKQKTSNTKKISPSDIEDVNGDIILGGRDTNPTVETHWPTGNFK